MKRYNCTCALENGEKYCPIHKKKMNRNFYKQEENQYSFMEEENNDE